MNTAATATATIEYAMNTSRTVYTVRIVYGNIIATYDTKEAAESFAEWYHKTLRDYDPVYSTNVQDYVRIQEVEY